MTLTEHKHILIHVHIFKNAGSSFDSTLLSNFKDNFVDHREDTLIRENKNFLNTYLKVHTHIQAFSSHSIYYTPQSNESFHFHPVYFLRHPIERIKSVYSFEKKQPQEDSSGAQMAKKLDFESYIQWRMQKESPATIRNLQTIFLAGIGANPNDIKKKFDMAMQRIKESPLIGIVDRYDESMVVFEAHLEDFFPHVDLSYIRKNVTDTNLTASVDEKAYTLLQNLSPVLREIVEKENTFDLALYNESNNVLDRRIEFIKNFETKLSDFRIRCKVKELRIDMKEKNYRKVINICEDLLLQNKNNLHLNLLNIESLYKIQDYDKSLIQCEYIITKYHKNPWAYFYQIEIYLILEKKERAKEIYQKILLDFQNNPKNLQLILEQDFSKILNFN
ncbi:MAG: sulfotransferase family 2 domain-containing protein [Sulfurovum sp.]|nr:sulfotransferase family 2 domain-containing protein [Sulfurovum sp.]